MDDDLRPVHGAYTTANASGRRTDSYSADEVPLNSIAVHKNFTQVTTEGR